MKITENEKWYWFKEFVIELRRMNNEIMKEQNGVFVAISLIDESISDYVYMNPHSIDLRGKKSLVLRNNAYQRVDVKSLLLNRRVLEEK